MKNDAYYIARHSDGTCDVIIYDNLRMFDCEHGPEYDLDEYTLPGIPFHDRLEENVRENYEAWKAHAIAYEAEKDSISEALDDMVRRRRKDVRTAQMMCQNCIYYLCGMCRVVDRRPVQTAPDGYCRYYDFNGKPSHTEGQFVKEMVRRDEGKHQTHPGRKRWLLWLGKWRQRFNRH